MPLQRGAVGGIWLLVCLLAALGVLGGAWRQHRTLPVAAPPPLAGKVIAIDPGHGGPDPGAVVGDVLEKTVALAVAGRLAELLAAGGATVVLTRTDDSDLSGMAPGAAGRRRADLQARARHVATTGAQILVSIHANKFPSPRWSGAQTFYDPQGHPDGARLATAIQAELRRLTPTRRQAATIEQLVLNSVPVPAATVEVGFLSNPDEARRLTDPQYQQQVAVAIYVGVVRYLADLERQGPGTAGQ